MAHNRAIKLKERFTGPYRIIERVRHLAYRLDIKDNLNVHPVASVQHLRPGKAPVARTGQEDSSR